MRASRPKTAWLLRSLALCACIFAFILSATPLVAADCPVTADTPSCTPCTSSQSFIDVSALPRVDFAGKSVTNNIANLHVFDCDHSTCTAEFPPLDDIIHMRHSTHPFLRYLESLATYSIFGLCLFFVVLTCSISIVVFRYCCCCIGKGQGPACCGYAAPSPKNVPEFAHTGNTSCCWGCLGYIRDGTHPQGFAYPSCERWLARIIAWIAVVLIVSFTIAVAAAGAHQYGPAAQKVAASPQHAASAVHGLTGPATTFLAERANTALVTALQDVTRVIDTTIMVDEVRAGMKLVLEVVPTVKAPTTVEQSTTAWAERIDTAKPATNAFVSAFKAVENGLGASFTALADFTSLFVGEQKAAGQRSAPKLSYAAAPNAALAADAAFTPATDRYHGLFTAGQAVRSFISKITDAGAVNIPAGHAAETLKQLEKLSRAEQGGMSFSAFHIARETLRTRHSLVGRDWATTETDALLAFSALVAEHLSSADPQGLQSLTYHIQTLNSLYPLTPYADYAEAVTEAVTATTVDAAIAARAYPSTADGAATVGDAATRSTEFAQAMSRFRDTPLVDDDVTLFSAQASEVTSKTRFLIAQAKIFNTSLVRLDDILGDADERIGKLADTFAAFDAARGALARLQTTVQSTDAALERSQLAQRVRAYAAATPLSPQAQTALRAAATALNDPRIEQAAASASAAAVVDVIAALTRRLGGLLATFHRTATQWREDGALLAGVGSTVRKIGRQVAEMDSFRGDCTNAPGIACTSGADCAPGPPGPHAQCWVYTHCLNAAAGAEPTPAPLMRCATDDDCAELPGTVCGFFGLHAAATEEPGHDSWGSFITTVTDSWVRHDARLQSIMTSLSAPEFVNPDVTGSVAAIGDKIAAAVAGTADLRTAVAEPVSEITAATAALDDCRVAPWQESGRAMQLSFATFPKPADVIAATNSVVEAFDTFADEAMPVLSDFYSLIGPTITDCILPLQNSIGTATLAPLAREEGVAVVAEALVTAADTWATCTNDKQKLFRVDVDFASETADAIAALGRLASTSALASGPLSYILNVFLFDQVALDDPTQHRVGWKADGDGYKDDKLCFTHECMSNEAAVWAGADIGTIIHDVVRITDSRFTADASYNREYGVTLPTIAKISLIFPALLAIFLLAASLLGWARKTQGFGSASTHLANASLAMSFLVAVGGCVVVAAALWPALIATGDSCQSVNTLATGVITTVDVCATLNGRGSNTDCTFELGSRINVTVDIPAMFDSLATGDCSANSGLARAWRRVSDELVALPNEYITSRLDDPSDPVVGRFGPRLRQALENFADQSSDILASLSSEAQATAGCKALSQSYQAVLDSACCEGFAALYWSIAGWYLILWCTLICAIPAGLLGRKRFTHFLWGKMFEEHKSKTFALLPAASINNNKNSAPQDRYSGYVDRDISGEPFSPAVISGETSDAHHPYSSL